MKDSFLVIFSGLCVLSMLYIIHLNESRHITAIDMISPLA